MVVVVVDAVQGAVVVVVRGGSLCSGPGSRRHRSRSRSSISQVSRGGTDRAAVAIVAALPKLYYANPKGSVMVEMAMKETSKSHGSGQKEHRTNAWERGEKCVRRVEVEREREE